MARSYSMRGVQGAADRAAQLSRLYLLSTDPASRVHDVQDDPRFQHRGVDLIWERSDGKLLGIEVKGDRQGQRGNYFFELISNLEKDTPGCFLYSTADLFFYVLLAQRELHLLPMPQTREWFLPRASRYQLKHTHTRTGKIQYTTVGAIVPIREVQRGVESAARVRVTGDSGFETLPRMRATGTAP